LRLAMSLPSGFWSLIIGCHVRELYYSSYQCDGGLQLLGFEMDAAFFIKLCCLARTAISNVRFPFGFQKGSVPRGFASRRRGLRQHRSFRKMTAQSAVRGNLWGTLPSAGAVPAPKSPWKDRWRTDILYPQEGLLAVSSKPRCAGSSFAVVGSNAGGLAVGWTCLVSPVL
jgi:hypothetical protein